MAIRQVRTIPGVQIQSGDSYLAKDVREFMRQGMDFAVVTHEGRSAANIMHALSVYIRKHPEIEKEIYCCRRKDTVYLYRKEAYDK